MTLLIIAIVMLVGGLAVGVAVGQTRGHRKGYELGHKEGEDKARKELEDPQPICACKHNYAYHDDDGTCHGTTSLHVPGDPILSPGRTYVVAHKAGKTTTTPCQCRRYTGPEPLPKYIP